MLSQYETLKTDQPVDDRLSTAQKASPKLPREMLITVLAVMMATPVITILLLWKFMPPVHEGKLDATVTTMAVPQPDFYQVPHDQRPKFEGGSILVRNNSDYDWTHVKMRVNGFYSAFDVEPIEAGTEKEFLLSKFITRSGHGFQVGLVPVKSVSIYARRPGGDRATCDVEYEPIENK